MFYIDDKPVPFDPMTGEPMANIQLINGQWVLAPKLGKDVMPEYRVIPESLLRDAVLFEDKSTKKKIGYVDANRLADHLEKYQAPRGAGFDQFKKDIATAAGEIRKEWNAYVQASNERGIMPEIIRRGEQVEARLPKFGTPSPDTRYVPIGQNGTVKRTQIKPVETPAETTLAPTGGQYQGYIAGRDVFSSPWSALTGLDLTTPGLAFDADDNPMLILADPTQKGKKVYAVSQQEFMASIANMPKATIAQFQKALKAAGEWSGSIDGELNYLNRSDFADKLLVAAQGATQENLAAYSTKSNQVQGILGIINEAAKNAGGTQTSTTVTIVNRESAQQYLDNTYLNSIGRKATKKEVDEFYQKVQKEAKARPDVSTTTGTQTTRRQGFDESTLVDMASAQAEARPEFLAYQLSTNFYDALRGAAQLPVQFGEAPTTGPLGG